MTCSISGCDRKVFARTWCTKHYRRWRKNGDPNLPLNKYPEKDEIKLFLENVMKYVGNDCIIWPYSTGNGYGQVSINGKRKLAHRYICEVVNGHPPTKRHQAAHSCGNGRSGCITPKHLRWATVSENALDKHGHGTMKRGEDSSWAKLNESQVLEIFRRAKSGENQRAIAREFQINESTVSVIKLKKNWAWLIDGGKQ